MLQKINRSLGLVLLLLLSSCSWYGVQKPNILIIAIDHLSSDQLRCSQDPNKPKKGFHLLCSEGVRFTHAFTPSTLSLPALSSVLTAQYPYTHGLRNNGSQYLAGNIRTVTEAAHAKGYQTSLFSGGPPLTRVSGIQQGFDLFDDHLVPNLKSLYRNASQNVQLFLNWQKETKDKPFFTVLYLPDLSFIDTETVTDLGEIRNLSFDSQLDEIDESLGTLFQQMKKMKIWDQSYIIILGLNGRPSVIDGESAFQPIDLTSSNTQVGLLIKPPYKPRDQGLSWSQDRNVSLVDVGLTLFEILEEKNPSIDNMDNPIQSLNQAVQSPQYNWPQNRLIISESGWPTWRLGEPPFYAIRGDQFLYIWDGKESVYNSLADRAESNPMNLSDPSIQYFLKIARTLVNKLPDAHQNYEKTDLQSLAQLFDFNLWTKQPSDPERKNILRNHLSFDPPLPIGRWLIDYAIQNQEYSDLEKYSKKLNDPIWSQFARAINAGPKDLAMITEPCLQLLAKKAYTGIAARNCYLPRYLNLIEWIASSPEGTPPPDHLKQNLILSFYEETLDNMIASYSLGMGMIWNTSDSITGNRSLFYSVLSLPKYQKQRNWLQKEMLALKIDTQNR
ncbi:MAG: hypothetical protein BroJett040_04100 [Oligoflexia bacterium]|nr:MAG: hypothetical protein BroJett040_04100 [Oligoflexia bacterium]